jgi:type I restriction enzyme S subunit
MSDELTELPEGWKWAKLGDVLEVIRGASPRPKGDPKYFGGTIPWIMIADVSKSPGRYIAQTRDTVTEAGALKSRYLKAGTLILSNSGTVCVPKILAVDGCIHDGFVAFPDLPENIDVFYLYEFFTFIRPQIIEKYKQGVTQVNLNTEIVRSIDLILPPINEQKRIVAKIEELRDRLHRSKQALEAVPELCDRFRQSVLAAAFRGDLTADWREENPDVEPASVLLERIRSDRRRKWEETELQKLKAVGRIPKNSKWKDKYQEPEPCDDALLPKLPDEWRWVPVEFLATKVVDGVHKKPNYVEYGIPFVTVRNLTAGTGISFDKLNYVSQEDHEEFFKRANPEKGDLLISKDGTLGVTRVIRTDKVFSIFVSVALVKPVAYEMSDYLELAFCSPQMQNQMLGTGSGLQHIHLKDLRRYAVPVTSLKEQEEIVVRVRQLFKAIEEIQKQYDAAKVNLDCLNQSILAKAFRGELVEQDPNDEPASVLLDRIRAEREALQSKKKSQSTKGKRKKAKDDQLDLPELN